MNSKLITSKNLVISAQCFSKHYDLNQKFDFSAISSLCISINHLSETLSEYQSSQFFSIYKVIPCKNALHNFINFEHSILFNL